MDAVRNCPHPNLNLALEDREQNVKNGGNKMKVCIFGAGAIGGYVGVQLARAGVDVSLIARGQHLEAMRRNGVRLLKGDQEIVVHPVCTNDPAELGRQDYVIIGLKAHQLSSAVDQIQPLLAKHTGIVTAVNGIPYWYFYRHGARSRAVWWRASIRVGSNGAVWGPTVRSGASSIRRPRSSIPV